MRVAGIIIAVLTGSVTVQIAIWGWMEEERIFMAFFGTMVSLAMCWAVVVNVFAIVRDKRRASKG